MGQSIQFGKKPVRKRFHGTSTSGLKIRSVDPPSSQRRPKLSGSSAGQRPRLLVPLEQALPRGRSAENLGGQTLSNTRYKKDGWSTAGLRHWLAQRLDPGSRKRVDARRIQISYCHSRNGDSCEHLAFRPIINNVTRCFRVCTNQQECSAKRWDQALDDGKKVWR